MWWSPHHFYSHRQSRRDESSLDDSSPSLELVTKEVHLNNRQWNKPLYIPIPVSKHVTSKVPCSLIAEYSNIKIATLRN